MGYLSCGFLRAEKFFFVTIEKKILIKLWKLLPRARVCVTLRPSAIHPTRVVNEATNDSGGRSSIMLLVFMISLEFIPFGNNED